MATPVFVSANSNQNALITETVGMSPNPLVNEFIVCFMGVPSGSYTPTVTDTVTNSYTQFGTKFTAIGLDMYCFYATNITNASNTLSCTWSSVPSGTWEIIYVSYSGLQTPVTTDGAVTNSAASGATSVTSGNIITTNAVDLLVWYVGPNSVLTGLGAGETSRITTTFSDQVIDVATTSTGTYNLSGTQTSGSFLTRLVAFKATPAAAVVPSLSVNPRFFYP